MHQEILPDNLAIAAANNPRFGNVSTAPVDAVSTVDPNRVNVDPWKGKEGTPEYAAMMDRYNFSKETREAVVANDLRAREEAKRRLTVLNRIVDPDLRAMAAYEMDSAKGLGQEHMGALRGVDAAAEYERYRVIRDQQSEEQALARQETMNRRAALERLGQTYK
jgi:hypothetical protein